MTMENTPFCLRIFGLVLVLLAFPGLAVAKQPAGLVVEEVPPGGSVAKAGVEPGDQLFGWSTQGSSGQLTSVFDWWALVHGSAWNSDIELQGMRQGRGVTFRVPRGDWAGQLRPILPESLERAFNVAAGFPACQGQVGKNAWDGFFKSLEVTQRESPHLHAWASLQREMSLARCPEGPSSREDLEPTASRLNSPIHRAAFWLLLGESYFGMDMSGLALEMFQRAREEVNPQSTLQLAIAKFFLGKALLEEELLEAAILEEEQALALSRQVAPESLLEARVLWQRGRARELRGELEEGRLDLEANLEILEPLEVTPGERARTCRNLAILSARQGDFQGAQTGFETALGWAKQIDEPSPLMASILNNLGLVAYRRGDLDTAQRYLVEAQKIKRALSTTRPTEPSTLVNLGVIAVEREDYASASTFFQEALEVLRQSDPKSLGMATLLNNLGRVQRLQGNLSQAHEYHQQALAIQEQIAPSSLAVSESLERLAQVDEDQGKLAAAMRNYRRAQNLRETQAPSSHRNGILLYRMGQLARRRGEVAAASSLFGRAVSLVEERLEDLGGSHDQRQTFQSMFGSLFRDYVEVLLEQGRLDDAFELQERSRARIFREMLVERDVDLGQSLPGDWQLEREALANRYDEILIEIATLSPEAKSSETVRLEQELTELRWKRDELLEKGRQLSPRLAALQYPQALTVKEVQAVLSPGTLLLAYSVNEDRSIIFALSREKGVEVRVLDLSEAQLRSEVESLLSLVHQGAASQSRRAELRANSLKVASGRLFDLLLKPFESRISEAQRILLLPDGPLYPLPFSALVRDLSGQGSSEPEWQYLVEWKPVHLALSASLYGELQRASAEVPPDWPLVAFGAPRLPSEISSGSQEVSSDREVPVVSSVGVEARQLPGARREVERIAALFPGSRVFVGVEATEERVLALPSRLGILHFATHVRLDEHFPLDSALILSIPEGPAEGRANGLLQAWEIFEKLRIEAEIVVLSACESGLGKEVLGEGLISLNRAFHFAGARSVLASLWQVADGATAELMARFYHHLRAGRSKDEALRAAQLELIQGKSGVEFVAPYYWAAFQLSGDAGIGSRLD
ncbi:MAG: CHAT domain-containing protein [Deltaproteobacteria bacterium]|nr:CHAT domain-containing protein [Deltaproteobacteria bacterium]